MFCELLDDRLLQWIINVTNEVWSLSESVVARGERCEVTMCFGSFSIFSSCISMASPSSLPPSFAVGISIALCHLNASLYQRRRRRRRPRRRLTKFQFPILLWLRKRENTRKRRSEFKFNGFMTVNASSNVWFAHRGRSSVTVAAYRM